MEAKFRERGPQGDPKFWFMPLEVTLSFLFIFSKDSAVLLSQYRGKTKALMTSEGKNPHVGSFRERQFEEAGMRCWFCVWDRKCWVNRIL